jgi:DNA-binding NarL/FixJ family response regulator
MRVMSSHRSDLNSRSLKVLCVEDLPLLVDGLGLALKYIDPGSQLITVPAASLAMAALTNEDDFSLVLLDTQSYTEQAFELIEFIRHRFEALPVVVYSAADTPALVRRAFDAGVAGYISKRSSCAVLVCALRLVLAGGMYLPPALLDRQEEAALAEDQHVAALKAFKLTGREVDVLSLLVKGQSNKVISRELDIAESTTKTHVSSIMRALQVKNRTEVSALVNRLRLQGGSASSGGCPAAVEALARAGRSEHLGVRAG